ncbi:MAG: hypothetical protein KAG61_01690 [Bacteriovoracaceae bacterium]|nr:hypothetical protein [Bacteriovoracaceae bacterium]
MKYLAILALLIQFSSCSDSNNNKAAKKVKNEIKVTKEVPLPPSPKDIATKFLNAYKAKDLSTVKSLSGRVVSMTFSQKNFRSKIIKALEKWDGTIGDIKYMYGMAGTLNGIIPFGEVNQKTIWALSLIYTGKKWIFSIDGIKKIKKEEFREYSSQVFESNTVLKSIIGSWKCTKKVSNGKMESKETIAQLEYAFNNDKTVDIKKAGITATGNYTVKNNVIKITRIKKTGKKSRRYISKSTKLFFKSSSELLSANDYSFSVYKK